MSPSTSRLFDATHSGDTAALEKLLREDPYILHSLSLNPPSNSPLHLSCLLGHVDFARLVMENNNDLVKEKNQQGLTPLHVASSKGHLEIVKDLLRIDKEMCRAKDQSGRIALHCAAIKGKSDVAQELIKAYPETASEPTLRGETVLHLAVKNNQFEALPPLVGFLRDQNMDMNEFLNAQDTAGHQTILHVAVELQNLQMVKFITSENVDLTVINSDNLTALDIAVQRRTTNQSVDSEDIEDVLIAAAGGAGNNNRNQDHRIHIIAATTSNQTSSSPSPSSSFYLDPNKHYFRLNAVMVIAAMLATISFQAALNPPGGVWQDWDNTNTNTESNQSTSKQGSNDGDEVVLAQSPSPSPHSIKTSDNTDWDIPIIMYVKHENKHMPGKSISRELYADCFHNFIAGCNLCFFFSICTLLVILYSPHTTMILLSMMCLSLIFSMIAFLFGIALITDINVSIWLFYSACSVISIHTGCMAVTVALDRRMMFLEEWIEEKEIGSLCGRLKLLKWMGKKIAMWGGLKLKLKTVKWVIRGIEEFILMPLLCVLLSHAAERGIRMMNKE